jgi:hypothetical protein
MARVKHGPITADATGKIGEVVFAHLFGVPFVRKKQRPYVSNTPTQKANRDLFAIPAKRWPLSGWQKPRYYANICDILQVKPSATFVGAALKTLRTGSPVEIFPRTRRLSPFSGPVITPFPGGITINWGINATPHTVSIQSVAIADNGTGWQETNFAPPGTAMVSFFFYNSYFVGPPYTVLAFAVFPEILLPDPQIPQLWNRGRTCRVL